MTTPKTPVAKRKGGAAPPPVRISAKMREAIELRIAHGLNIQQACQKAGMTDGNWHKTMKRKAVQEYFEKRKLEYIQNVMRAKDHVKAEAIEVGRHLLHNAKSEAVRARMVEFFAGEDRASLIQVNVNTEKNGAYAYSRPGQRVVTIEGEASEPDPKG